MKPELSKRDFYTQKAREENYPARSVYKLKAIDEKYHLFRRGSRALDLGCSPGSWLLYIAKKIGRQGRVVGVDIAALKITLSPNMVFLKKDVKDADLWDSSELQQKYSVVVSDLSPKTSGIKAKDARESLLLAERAFEIATMVLEKGGNFLCKIFEGEGSEEFLKKVKEHFHFVKKFKPEAVKKGSREFYIIAKGFLRNPVGFEN